MKEFEIHMQEEAQSQCSHRGPLRDETRSRTRVRFSSN